MPRGVHTYLYITGTDYDGLPGIMPGLTKQGSNVVRTPFGLMHASVVRNGE